MKNISIVAVCVAALCAGVSASARIAAGELRRDFAGAVSGEGEQDKVDFAVIEKIRAEGMERSKILETFDYLVSNIGPRLTNSPAHKRAIAWTQEQLKAYGLSEVHTEPWQFGRGWTLNKISIEMVEPRYMPLIGYPMGWSPSTPGRIVATPSILTGARVDGAAVSSAATPTSSSFTAAG